MAPALLAGLALRARGSRAAVPVLALAAVVAWTFRDPPRAPPSEYGTVYAPADGRVIAVEDNAIQIFLPLYGVHVARSPAAGILTAWEWAGTSRWPAMWPQASGNYRAELRIGEVEVTLISGLFARRITPWVRAGQRVAAGDRLGIIHLGSRADVRLPAGYEVTVATGARVRAGQTPVARRSPPPLPGDQPPA